MSANYSRFTYLIGQARKGTLAHDNQDLQLLRKHANQGVREAQNLLREISEAGGANGSSVNKVV